MGKRWKVIVSEWEDSNDETVGIYNERYGQYLDTLDLEELILWVNRLEATKKAPS